jgi:hypothetical protein
VTSPFVWSSFFRTNWPTEPNLAMAKFKSISVDICSFFEQLQHFFFFQFYAPLPNKAQPLPALKEARHERELHNYKRKNIYGVANN